MLAPFCCSAWATSLIPQGEGTARNLGAVFSEGAIPASTRRRIGAFSRTVVASALGVMNGDDADIVLVSRYGDLSLAYRLLLDVVGGALPSPAAFSMSVHNAVLGVIDQLRASRTGHTALAASRDVLGAGLLEAASRLSVCPGRAVLLIVAESLFHPDLEQFAGGRGQEILVMMLTSTEKAGGCVPVFSAMAGSGLHEADNQVLQLVDWLDAPEVGAALSWESQGLAWSVQYAS